MIPDGPMFPDQYLFPCSFSDTNLFNLMYYISHFKLGFTNYNYHRIHSFIYIYILLNIKILPGTEDMLHKALTKRENSPASVLSFVTSSHQKRIYVYDHVKIKK